MKRQKQREVDTCTRGVLLLLLGGSFTLKAACSFGNCICGVRSLCFVPVLWWEAIFDNVD